VTALILAGPFALLGIAAGVVALAQGAGSMGHLTDLNAEGRDR
jgi:hypothetical protein